jgi:small multidrug resistance pump
MNPYVLLFSAIAAEVIGTTALRLSEGFTKLLPSVVVVVGYGLAFYLLSLTLKELNIGVAYAIWAGVGTAVTALIGVVLFKEQLNLLSIVGIGMIIGGVVLLNLFSKAHG